MRGLACLFVIALGAQVISSQGPPGPYGGPPGGPPHKCSRPPPGVKNPQSCCQAKPMYTEEELKECGFEKIDEENPQPGPPPPPDCSKQECLLKKRDLLNPDNSINYDAARAYMKNWVAENAEFEAAAEAATNVCMGENGPPGPPKICEANRLMFCVGAVIFTNCPTWQDTDDCKTLKEHMEECRGPNFPPPN